MGQRFTITESERNRIKDLYENKIGVNEQSSLASDLIGAYKKSDFNPFNVGKKVANYVNQTAQAKQAEIDNSDPSNIKNAVANFILVLTKQLGYKHFQGSKTGLKSGDVILTKKLKYGHVMVMVNVENGDIDGIYSVDGMDGYGMEGYLDRDDFKQFKRVGNVKNWNKAMIQNFEKNLEDHASLQGQTGGGSLAEGKNRIKGLYEQATEPQSMQQLRQDQRAVRQQTRQDQRAVRRDTRAEQAAVADIMNLRNEFNTLMTNLQDLSRHQNTETYKNFLDLITNTSNSLKGFVDSTANASQPPTSENF